MNFYEILQVEPSATKHEIKKAYHNLAIKYHPDKCPDAQDKFIEIKTAYEVLYDDNKRIQYDIMSHETRGKVYDIIKQYFTTIRPEYSYMYEALINMLYSDEHDFEHDINNFDFKKIFSRLTDKIKSNCEHVTTNTHTISLSLKEKYECITKKIKINNTYYIIPTYQDITIINDPLLGKVTITITCEDNLYKIINRHDLLITQSVSLSQYIYGGKIKVHHVDDSILWLDIDCCLEKKPVFVISKKGLYTGFEMERGDLYVHVACEGININTDNDVGQAYSTVVRETITLMFPPI